MTESAAPTLKRVLTVWNLTLFGVVAMAPIAGVTMYGFVAALSAGAVIPAYLLAGFGVGLTALSFAAMAEAAPGAGSVYGYASHAMGPVPGFMGGWAILLDYLLLTALVIVFGAYYATGALPWVPIDVATALFGLFALTVALARVGWSCKADMALTLAQSLMVGLLVVLAVAAVAIMTAAFLATGWALSGLSGAMSGLDPTDAGFQIVSARFPMLSVPLGLVVAASPGLGGSLVCTTGSARILYAMSRDGHRLVPLSRLHPQFRSPWIAVILVAVLGTALAFWALPHADILSGLVSFGALTGFLLVNLSVIATYGLRQKSRHWLRHWLLPLLGAGVIV
jgi:amino acid transporter